MEVSFCRGIYPQVCFPSLYMMMMIMIFIEMTFSQNVIFKKYLNINTYTKMLYEIH